MVKKLNNRGLSLVELIIAISMATIVIAAATIFLYNAERSYRISKYSVDLQMESQILMEQLSNWVMESNRIVVADSGKVLVLYRIPREKLKYDTAGPVPNTNQSYYRTIIYLDDEKLYIDIEEASDPSAYIAEMQSDSTIYSVVPSPENCIGEHVNSFEVSYPAGVDPANANSVEVKIRLEEGNANTQMQSYIVSNVFSLRNSVYKFTTPDPSASPAPTTGP